MAFKDLFRSGRGRLQPADTINRAGGTAYALGPKEALAQLATTSCLGGVFYESAEGQLTEVIARAESLDDRFIAQLAIYAREEGRMKDLPALLCALLVSRGSDHLPAVFERVIDTPRQLRAFVQIVRSGVTGRRSFGSRTKRLIETWLQSRTDAQLVRGSFGQDPSMADIVKMVHPKPTTAARSALYASWIDRPHVAAELPDLARELAAFRAGETLEVPDVPFPLIASGDLTAAQWKQVARNAPIQTTRMQLNTFARHGVFEDGEIVDLVAARLKDREAIGRSGMQPYQVLVGLQNIDATVPGVIREALVEALEISVDAVPRWPGKVAVCVDVSGSMGSPITGWRRGATSVVRCVDVAALITAAVLRQNPSATVVPFDTEVRDVTVRGRDSIATTAETLARLCGGGTNCTSAMEFLVRRKIDADLVVFVSDNQSWLDARRGESALLKTWNRFRGRNRDAKLVCLDLQPYGDAPVPTRDDIANIGGFSDAVFTRIDEFARSDGDPARWVEVIERIAV